MSAWTLNLLLVVFLCLASFPLKTKQQDDSNDNNDYTPCSFISGEGCMNGVCKFCALCLPTYCILATPYYTGDSNQGSICEATSQEYGYDFYNYCLLSTQDDDSCSTSTLCYPYRQNNSSMQHSWTNLTCDQNTCQLIMNDGSSPPIPIPLDIHPSNNVSTYSKYNIRSKSPTSIALTTISIIIGICFLILLAKIISRNPKLSSLFGCCFVSKTTRTRSRPPSYQVVHQPMIEILPSYDQQEPSPPKYEQAIVTQIRGHHPYSETAASTSSSAATPIWIPVYINHDQPTNRTTISSPMFRTFLTSNDWATIRHHPPPESLRSFSMIEQVSDNEDAEERRRR